MLPEDNHRTHNQAAEPLSSAGLPFDQGRLEKQRRMVEIYAAISASASLEESISSVVSRLREIYAGCRISVLLVEGSGPLQVRASAGVGDLPGLPLLAVMREGATARAAAERQPILSGNIAPDPGNPLPGLPVRSEPAVPLLFHQELIGALLLENVQPDYFDESDRSSLSALGVILGGMIKNFRLADQVRQQALYEQQMVEVAHDIRRPANIQAILETSAREIAQTLGARRVRIRIKPNEDEPGREENHP
jgi:transcriptional regulator with GAF, ATPase, and Fis domain